MSEYTLPPLTKESKKMNTPPPSIHAKPGKKCWILHFFPCFYSMWMSCIAVDNNAYEQNLLTLELKMMTVVGLVKRGNGFNAFVMLQLNFCKH